MPPDPLTDHSTCSDEELMEAVQHDDAAAYRTLFERHQARVYGFLVRRTRSTEVASDLYQETFLKVHRARHTWTPGRPFRPWLFGIAANTARDHARKRRRLPVEVELDDIRPPVVHERHDARIQLEAAVAGLPDNLREAFLLGVVEGFDHREVAAHLGITPVNARARISRARAQLRLALRGGE